MTRYPPSPPKRATRRWAVLALGRNRSSAAIVDQESTPAGRRHEACHEPFPERCPDVAPPTKRDRPDGARPKPRWDFERCQHADSACKNRLANAEREQQE